MTLLVSILCIAAYYAVVSTMQLQIENTFFIAIVYVFTPIIFIPLIAHGVVSHFRGKRAVEAIRAKLKADGFSTSHELPSVLVDSKSKRVCFYETSDDGSVRYWPLHFSDVLGTSIVKDGATVHKTSNMSVIGRAIAGGVVLGGVGALLGGITATSSTTTKVVKLVLEIVLNCPAHPVHRVLFIGSLDGVAEGSPSFNEAMKKVEFMQLLMELMMMDESIPPAENSVDLMDTVRMVKLLAQRDMSTT